MQPGNQAAVSWSLISTPGNGVSPQRSVLMGLCRASVEDLERNDGSLDRPYYMSKALLKILGKKNEVPSGDKKRKK